VHQLPRPQWSRRRPEPQSLEKTIPPLSGTEFFEEFNTGAKIIEIIRTGSVLGVRRS
jgi:hypothetical protein